MNKKYVLISGLSFNEEEDLAKLRNYAKNGWILEAILGGIIYKLRRGVPEDLVYTVDYQKEANSEYFLILKEAGWNHVISVGNEIHFFSGKNGIAPIYSEKEDTLTKYQSICKSTKKGMIYSSIILLLLLTTLIISAKFIRTIFLIVLGLTAVDIIILTFYAISYLGYKAKMKPGRITKINTALLQKVYFVSGILLLIMGVVDILQKNYYSIFIIILGVLSIIFGFNCKRKNI